MSNICVCLYLELICIIEVYAHSRDHPRLEQSRQDLFGNCICDEVEVEWVSSDMRKGKKCISSQVSNSYCKRTTSELIEFYLCLRSQGKAYSTFGGVLLFGQNAETLTI